MMDSIALNYESKTLPHLTGHSSCIFITAMRQVSTMLGKNLATVLDGCCQAGGKRQAYCPDGCAMKLGEKFTVHQRTFLSRPAGMQLHQGCATLTWVYNPVLGMQPRCGHPGDPESQSYLCATPPRAAGDPESQSYLRATPAWASQRIRESVLPV